MYEVKEYFLEDALRDTGFSSAAMARAKAELRTRPALSSWTEHAAETPLAGAAGLERPNIPAPILGQQTEVRRGPVVMGRGWTSPPSWLQCKRQKSCGTNCSQDRIGIRNVELKC